MCGLDASWLSGAEEAGKKAFHSCALPWDTDWVTQLFSINPFCMPAHTLHHVKTAKHYCVCVFNNAYLLQYLDQVVSVSDYIK